MIRVTHIITGLAANGAESMLYRLISGMDRRRFHHEVLSLTDFGEIGARLEADGIPVSALGAARSTTNPWHLVSLARRLRRTRPDMVQTWMYHSDLAGSLAAAMLGRKVPVVWGIHHSNLDPQSNKRRTILTARACARLSRFVPARIICCSESSRQLHASIGYAASKMEVVPNGFDLQVFRPNLAAGQELRQKIAIPPDAVVIGMAARFHVQKDHRNFTEAAGRLHRLFPAVRFLMCGHDIAWDNTELAGWIDAAGIRDRCHLLGRRDDVARIYPALDIVASSSIAEAFPLSVGEAMACGVPCAVTDVGDSRPLVGETGRVVPPSDPAALAQAWRELILMGAEGRRRLGLEARSRIEQYFSIEATVERYASIYDRVARHAPFEPAAEPALGRREQYRTAGGRDAA